MEKKRSAQMAAAEKKDDIGCETNGVKPWESGTLQEVGAPKNDSHLGGHKTAFNNKIENKIVI